MSERDAEVFPEALLDALSLDCWGLLSPRFIFLITLVSEIVIVVVCPDSVMSAPIRGVPIEFGELPAFEPPGVP